MLYNLSTAVPFAYTPDFEEYLTQSKDEAFILNLAGEPLDYVIQEYCNTHRTRSPHIDRNFKSLNLTLSLIEEQFQCELMPHQITDIFWEHFISFSQERGLALSTIKTTIHQLKAVLNWASRYNAHVAPSFDMVKMPNYTNQQIALTPAEVSRIYYFDVDTVPKQRHARRKLRKVKDLFVLSCCLGQRHSDMIRITKSHFDRNIFKILQQKTNDYAYVNIDKMAIDKRIAYEILERYNYENPYPSSLSAYNIGLKDLFMYAGFTQDFVRECKINGTVETKVYKKWELIGSHTARRTFITTNILRNYSIAEIMRASGHKTYSAFQRYLCYEND